MSKKRKQAREAERYLSTHAPAPKPSDGVGFCCTRCGARLENGPADQDAHNWRTHLMGHARG